MREDRMENYTRKMKKGLEEKIRVYIGDREVNSLSEFASKSEDGLQRKQRKKPDIRMQYSRDADRIIHTHAYSRYIDKTQVFFLVDDDHITHRVLHVQLVSKIARTIGRALKLNEDLIEAISLGHDIGHVPFGHLGEEILCELCKDNNIGRFLHNVQSIQFLDAIEDCNLTLQVLDGILCHNGEEHSQMLKPERDKDWDKFDKEIKEIRNGKKDYVPMTLEGCVVRFADTIAYLGRDLQDAIYLGLIKDESEVPEICAERIGVENNDIVNTLIIDIIENSYEKDYISYSEEISDCLEKYKEFNNKHIYDHEQLLAEKDKIKKMYEILYKTFLGDLKNDNSESKIYEHFVNLDWINQNYKDNSNDAEKVRDYIAGMTDRYFETVFKEIMFPKRVSTFK